MEYISNWVKNIIIIVLITTFLGMFLPENNLRKYVRVVMGFFIISIFISPVSLILNGKLELNNNIIPGNKMEIKWKQIKASGEKVKEKNNQLMQEYYTERINKKVGDIVSINLSDRKYKISSKMKNKYKIERINISIYESKGIKNINIQPINIEQKESTEEITAKLETKILKLQNNICDILQISPSIVNIKYYNGGELIAVY